MSLYRKDVKEKKFPQESNSFHMDKNELGKVLRKLEQQGNLRNDDAQVTDKNSIEKK
jgi:hypothetical protein